MRPDRPPHPRSVGHDDQMGVQAYLYQGTIWMHRLADPGGGTFDSAGDFDELLPVGDAGFPILGGVNPHDDLELDRTTMPDLIGEIDRLLAVSRDDRERRGLRRLRALADLCSRTERSRLILIGD
jgi:hypothetical protein